MLPTNISNDELDVKKSIADIWLSLSKTQRSDFKEFCGAAGKIEKGLPEFERIVAALCKSNGVSKRPRELASKGFCEALVETVSKYDEALSI